MRRLCFLCAICLIAGCSSSSFVGQRVGNFTAYYNTFYNAEASFDEGVRAVSNRQEVALDRTRYLTLFDPPAQNAGKASFEKAIVKSADVLRDHAESKWADDALLLIGKSYFQLGQFAGAEQYFREVIYALAEQTGRPSPLEDEARFWLARTLVNNEAYDRAEPFLEETLAREDVPRRWEGRYHLVQADLYVQQENWSAAAQALRAGIEKVRDNDLRARAYFLLGQVEETRGAYAEAVEAYARVDRFKPAYNLRYAGQLSAIRVEGQHLLNTHAALEKLRRMERDGKNYEFRNELRYVRGQILQASGRPDEAFNVYDDVLYGGDGDISRLRGPVHYALGTLYRDVYEEYFAAAAHFDTAATGLGAPVPGARAELRTPEAIEDAADMKTTFGSFASAMRQIQEADSLLELGSLSPEAFAARVREIRQARARELEIQQRELERRNAQRAFGGDAGRQGAATGVQPVADAESAAQSGFLSYRDPVRVRENREAFFSLWGDRPLVDNWRRSASISGTDRVDLEASLEPGATPDGVGASDVETALPQVDLSPIPRTIETQTAMRTRRAAARYQLGNVLFLNMNRPDSAAAWYRIVIENDPDEDVAPRAYYALAEVQRALGDSLAAMALFRETLSAYPQSDFAGRIREELGMAPVAALDSTALAQAAYDRARGRWIAGAFAPAFDSLLAIPAAYPHTPAAPRALFAAGMVFLEWAARDSLSVLDVPLPATAAQLAAAGLPVPTVTDDVRTDTGEPTIPVNTTGLLTPDAPAPTLPEERGEREGVNTRNPGLHGLTVRDLFRHVQQSYSDTPFAARAGTITAELDARFAARAQQEQEALPADTTGMQLPLQAEGGTEPDAELKGEMQPNPMLEPDEQLFREEDAVKVNERVSPAEESRGERRTQEPEMRRDDTTGESEVERAVEKEAAIVGQAAPAFSPTQTDGEAKDPALYGSAPVERGYTLVIGSRSTEGEAEQLAEMYRQHGLRVTVLEAEDSEGVQHFRVGIGAFEQADQAQQSRSTLEGLIPPDAWVMKVQ